MRQIEIGTDVFAAIWAARSEEEETEDAILARIFKVGRPQRAQKNSVESDRRMPNQVTRLENKPISKKWTDLLIWTLNELGGKASLEEIYRKSREGRRLVGYPTTPEHDASARECLESHCSDSKKYRHRADLFYMPEGKGAGVWALR